MTELGSDALHFGNVLGFNETEELFIVSRRKWQLIERAAAQAGEKVIIGTGPEAIVLYDPLSDFAESQADWMLLIGPYGQSGYELAPPANTSLAIRCGDSVPGTVAYLREVAGPYDLALYVYVGQGPPPAWTPNGG